MQRRERLFDLVGLHGDDDRVGEGDQVGRPFEGADAALLRVALQLREVARAGAHLLRGEGSLAEQPLGQRAGHVAETDESESHRAAVFE